MLDFGLSHTNSAVVMATAKLFLHYAAPFPDQNARVLDRVRDALSILVAGREPEVVHAILANALVLAQRYPHAFAPVRGYRVKRYCLIPPCEGLVIHARYVTCACAFCIARHTLQV